MSIESQRSITDWADWTFGPVEQRAHAVRRAAKEMEEFTALFRLLRADEPVSDAQLLGEAADVVITLFRLASFLQSDLLAEVDRKMRINRLRSWVADGTGHGQHRPADAPTERNVADEIMKINSQEG